MRKVTAKLFVTVGELGLLIMIASIFGAIAIFFLGGTTSTMITGLGGQLILTALWMIIPIFGGFCAGDLISEGEFEGYVLESLMNLLDGR